MRQKTLQVKDKEGGKEGSERWKGSTLARWIMKFLRRPSLLFSEVSHLREAVRIYANMGESRAPGE